MQQDTISRPDLNRDDSIAVGKISAKTLTSFPDQRLTQEKYFRPADIQVSGFENFTGTVQPGEKPPELFPYSFVSSARAFREEKLLILKKNLRDGIERIPAQFPADWLIPVLMFSSLIYIILGKIPGNLFRGLANYLTFKGIGDRYSEESEKIFRIQSTLMNLASFINISLFIYLAAIETGHGSLLTGGILLWLACFSVVTAVVTARHIITFLTGILSEERDIFSNYLSTIYNFYRILGLISLLLIILSAYSVLLPVRVLITAGFILAIIMIIIRILRLFLLFISRRASILHLILYLCALEILPVAVLFRYAAGQISGL